MPSKKGFLGDNPLSSDGILRGMIRGRPMEEEAPTPPAPKPMPRAPLRQVAPAREAARTDDAAPLRKTIYFSPMEWQAIRARAYEEDRPYSDIVREAVRLLLDLPG